MNLTFFRSMLKHAKQLTVYDNLTDFYMSLIDKKEGYKMKQTPNYNKMTDILVSQQSQ